MTKDTDLHAEMNEVAALAGQATVAMAQGQAAAMDLLLCEMQALCALIPGMHMPPDSDGDSNGGAAAAKVAREDAEIEAGFDNMPV